MRFVFFFSFFFFNINLTTFLLFLFGHYLCVGRSVGWLGSQTKDKPKIQ